MMKNKGKILTVDDNTNTREIIQRNLKNEGYTVLTASNVNSAIKILENTEIDLIITDLKMPHISGLDLVKHVRENYKNSEVIVITGYPTIESAVEAVKIGADDYIAKPFKNKDLFKAVERAFDKLKNKKRIGSEEIFSFNEKYGIIGESSAIRKVFREIEKASKIIKTVLITGESGTGKELIARAIHYNSIRSSAPFVPINCSAIPENLLESELFGYIKGAFTGANETRAGFFQTADGGTIFLDEIGETSTLMQVKLLRVIQEKEIYMVGSKKNQKVDVRILAATNKDLYHLVETGKFREDLYYRLNVISLDIPPLRDRNGDILLLIDYFCSKYAPELGKSVPKIDDKALNILKKFRWPGNVRELENVIQRLIVMSDSDKIEVTDLPSIMRFSAFGKSSFTRTLAEVEKEYVRNVLENVGGNKTKAAKILGIDRKTLREKLK